MATLIHASLHAYLMTDTHKNSPKTFHEKMISKLLEHAASDAMLPWSILKYSRLICTIPTFCATFSLSTISEVIWRMVFLPWKMFIGMCGSIIMRRRQITKERPSGSPVESIGLVSNMLSDLVHPMLSFVLVLCCLPLMLLVSIVYRLSNNALTSTILKRNSDVIMVQSQDTLCLQRARSNVDILNCLLLLKGRMDLAKLRKLVLERLVEARGESGHLLLPKLTRYCKSIAGCYVWVKDETYDVIDHVFKWNSQCPSTREELETLLGYLSSQPLPKEKAPWQVVMIPSSSMLERQCFVLFRIHHSIADSANFSEKILRPLVDVKPTLSQKPVSGVTKKYMEALKVLSMGPSVLLQKLSLPVEDHCLYGQPLSGDRLTTWSEQLDLALIKEMARASKSTTNAVLLSCLTGTFRDYFKHHSHKIPEDMLAYVSVPSEISSKSLISKDNSVFVILSLPLKLNDPIRHLEVIQSRMESSATSVEPAINTLISSQFTGKVPLWMSSLLDRIIADKCTLVLCEASCPQSKVFIGGNAVEDIILWSGQPANVADGSSGFPAAADRYHLYVSLACPWAHRVLIVRELKGLQDVLPYTVVDWHLTPKGWNFTDQKPKCTLDTVNNKQYLREVYELADPEYKGNITVPVLWDKVQKTIVNNESSEIMRMLNTEFNAFCKTLEQKQLNLYPEELRAEIDGVNEWIYPNINNGVYRSGFARQQEAYNEAVTALFKALDRVEDILSKQRYLCGHRFTEADVRLFTTLIRFDPVYACHFKCNKKRIVDYPNIWAYTREIFQIPGIAETVDQEHIQKSYQVSQTSINPFSIVAIGPDLDYNKPHGRNHF